MLHSCAQASLSSWCRTKHFEAYPERYNHAWSFLHLNHSNVSFYCAWFWIDLGIDFPSKSHVFNVSFWLFIGCVCMSLQTLVHLVASFDTCFNLDHWDHFNSVSKRLQTRVCGQPLLCHVFKSYRSVCTRLHAPARLFKWPHVLFWVAVLGSTKMGTIKAIFLSFSHTHLRENQPFLERESLISSFFLWTWCSWWLELALLIYL